MVKIETIIEAVLATVPAGDKLDPGVTIAKIRRRSKPSEANEYYASLVRWPKPRTKMVVAYAVGRSMQAACEDLAVALGIKFEEGEDHT